MKWSGQHIYDLISRFRNDVYLENISTGTIASGAHLGLDSNNKIVKAVDGGGDLTGITAGTGLSGESLTGPVPTLNVDAAQTQITSIGTIATGTWQGSVIASAYLDADTAHLTTTQTFTGAKTFSAATTTFTSATADSPLIKVLNTTDDDQAGQLIFEKLRDDDGVAQGQNLGEIWFKGQDAAQNTQNYAYVIGEIDVSTGGQESGQLVLGIANEDGGMGRGLILIGGSADNEIDVTVGLGAASVVTIPGDIDLAGDIDVDGTLETDALTIGGATIAAIGTTAITTLGTIGTGVWNGTKITDIYTNSSGKRYGSTIKILPSDFMINDDAASPLSFKDGSNSGVHVNDSSSEAIAFVTIPEGMKATLVDVYGSHNKTLKVWEVDVNASFDFTSTTIGTGAMNTQLDITDTNATATNYLAVQVTLTATTQRIWGGIVTIAPQ